MAKFSNNNHPEVLFLVCLILSTNLIQTCVDCQKQLADPVSDDNEVFEKAPRPIEHISPNQCQLNQCLVVGMQAYSEARCVDLGKEGDFCRPEDWANNLTLYYPHKTVEAENIFRLFCPCSAGLECEQATCKRM